MSSKLLVETRDRVRWLTVNRAERAAAVVESERRRCGAPPVREPARASRRERAAADVRDVAVRDRAPQAASGLSEQMRPARPVDEVEDLPVLLAERQPVRGRSDDEPLGAAIREGDAGSVRGRRPGAGRGKNGDGEHQRRRRPTAAARVLTTPGRHRA